MKLPIPEYINWRDGTYYFVWIEWYQSILAMYLINDNWEKWWYPNYYSKIIRPITKWESYTGVEWSDIS